MSSDNSDNWRGGRPARETLRARSERERKDAVPRPAGRARTFKIVAAALVLAVFGAAIAYVMTEEESAPPPLVTAEDTPLKVKPEDPGGLQVPDQDKEVYDRVSGRDDGVREQLLPPAEKPRDDLQSQDKPAAAEPAPADAVTPTDETTPDGETTTGGETETAMAAPTPETETRPVTEPEPEPRAESTVAAAEGDYFVQVGSYRDRASAEAAWTRLEAKHSTILAGAGQDIERADLGARGVFYRLRAGGYATRADAEDACGDLKAAGTDCLVVSR